MRLRNQVKRVRERLGLTVADVAERTDLTRQTIYAIERDNGYRPKFNVVLALARGLNHEPAALFWEEPEPAKAGVA